MIRAVLTSLLMLLGVPVAAQQVVPCDWAARADAIVEPWAAHTRTFANGNVRLALLDTVEPAAGAFHLLVLSPPFNELGERQCLIVRYNESLGFAGLQFDTLTASYDPALGLGFDFEVQLFDATQGDFYAARLLVVVNQATGDVAAQLAGFD